MNKHLKKLMTNFSEEFSPKKVIMLEERMAWFTDKELSEGVAQIIKHEDVFPTVGVLVAYFEQSKARNFKYSEIKTNG